MLRSRVLTIVAEREGIDVGAIAPSEEWKQWLWTLKKSAFEFTLTAKSADWIDSLEYAAVSEVVLEMSAGW